MNAKSTVDDEGARKSRKFNVDADSEFVNALFQEGPDFFREFILTQSPSQIDAELRMMSVDAETVTVFLRQMKIGIESRVEFEIYQSVLLTFLKIHGDIFGTEESKLELQSMRESIEPVWAELDTQFQYVLCMISFCRRI